MSYQKLTLLIESMRVGETLSRGRLIVRRLRPDRFRVERRGTKFQPVAIFGTSGGAANKLLCQKRALSQ